ncbi:MAG: hypothetical protein RLZZ598_926, partial [Pseudomonadota bacterium]
LPAWKAEDGLERLKRGLRDIRLLSERGAARFDWKGMLAIEAAVDGKVIRVRIAKRPARTPEWETKTLSNGTDVQHWLEDARKRIVRWSEDER